MQLPEIEIVTYSSAMTNSKSIFALVLLGAGCLPDSSDEQQFDQTSFALDEESIQIVYDEASGSIGIGVDIEEMSRQVDGATIELQVDVTTPDRIKTRHELDWTPGDERALAGFGVHALSNGLYQVELTRLSIDGETIDGMTAHRSMRLLGVRSHGHEGGQNEGCKKGDRIEGTSGSDELTGTKNNDEILGKEGNDTLEGKECRDILRGGKGKDELRGGKGKDELYGGEGKDECYGGAGSDMFFGCEEVHQG